jgi:sporulation protein YlmC with PRC-barrel domain
MAIRHSLSCGLFAALLALAAQAQITPEDPRLPPGPTDDRPDPTTEQMPLPPPPADQDSQRRPFPEDEPMPNEEDFPETPPEPRQTPPDEDTSLPPEPIDNTRAPGTASAAADVIGTEVKTPQGETIGKVQNVIVDSGSGEATHAVLAHGNAERGNLKLTAVPWDTLQDMRHGNAIVMERVRLESAPSFSPDAVPDLTDPAWSREPDRYWRSIRTAGGETGGEERR